MMFLVKPPPKLPINEQPLQPWGSDQSKIMNLILQSAAAEAKIAKQINQEQKSARTPRKQRQSYNFYTNLRKYEKKKAQDFLSKKDVNFIQRNIKQLSEDYTTVNEKYSKGLLDKMIEDKQEKQKSLARNDYKSPVEVINWSAVMQYQDIKHEKKDKRKAINNFLKFQSSHVKKQETNDFIESSFENEQVRQYEPGQYQRLIKFRERLKKRSSNTLYKSHLQQNQRKIQLSYKSIKPASNTNYDYFSKTILRNTKTSQSQRKAKTTLIIQNLNEQSSKIIATSNTLKIQARKLNKSDIKDLSFSQKMKGK